MADNRTAGLRQRSTLELAEEACLLLKEGGEAVGIQARQAGKLVDKLRDNDITVAVIGQFKRGKSTLSNVILGDDIMPVGIIPVTSAVSKVRYGARKAEVRFRNGAVEEIPFDRLDDYISEQKNPGNSLGVEEVLLHTPSDFLRSGISFVDTPGVGSFHRNNTETAYRHMQESDAVIFLLSVDSPINQIEIDFLRNTREYAGKFYFAVNKTDLVSRADLEAYTEYCRKLLREIIDTDDIRLWPVSSLTGEGVGELRQAIVSDIDTHIREIMELSTRKKLYDLVRSSLNQLDFYWKALRLSYAELDEKFRVMSGFMEKELEKAGDCTAMFEVRLNELKLALSEKVCEVFGMEYGFEIEEMRPGSALMTKEEFIQKAHELCEGLQQTLSAILVYREEDAFIVVRRVEDINKLTRHLRSILSAVRPRQPGGDIIR